MSLVSRFSGHKLLRVKVSFIKYESEWRSPSLYIPPRNWDIMDWDIRNSFDWDSEAEVRWQPWHILTPPLIDPLFYVLNTNQIPLSFNAPLHACSVINWSEEYCTGITERVGKQLLRYVQKYLLKMQLHFSPPTPFPWLQFEAQVNWKHNGSLFLLSVPFLKEGKLKYATSWPQICTYVPSEEIFVVVVLKWC